MKRLSLLRQLLERLCREHNLDIELRPEFDRIHLEFALQDEERADRLIRAMRVSVASFGPEYWLPDGHPMASNFRREDHMAYRVYKSFIQGRLVWDVAFILCSPDTGYSLVEDTQP